MRKLLYVLVGLVVLLIVAVFALPPLLGPSMIKPRVAEAVRDATGRELRIDGDFSLSTGSPARGRGFGGMDLGAFVPAPAWITGEPNEGH